MGRVAVGMINAAWGLKGHVKVTPLTSNPDRLAVDAELLIRGQRRRVLEHVEPYGYPILRFEGYPDRTAAEALRGEVIEIEEDELRELPPGEYYVDDLVGMDVVMPDGEAVGRLVDVLSTGANDVYVVRRQGARDVLIPAIPNVVLDVDVAGKRMTIDPLPGLLDD
ncbi:MAG: ribosome maturation factor RimM [Dehalococcoidia bacterium]